MRQLMRLLRYALPRWWQILSSFLLMAAVGGLDAFKYLLVRPVFDRVLNPRDRFEGHSTLPQSPHAQSGVLATVRAVALYECLDHRRVCPGRIHRPQGNLRLLRHVSGELCRLRHDHRPARRSLHRSAAPLRRIFFQAHHRDPTLHHHQRRRASPVRHVDRAGGIPAAILHFYFYRGPGRDSGWESCVGITSVRPRDCVLFAQDRFSRAPHHTAWTG